MSPENLLNIYHQGFFPMAESRDDSGFEFFAPHTRALLPINDLHIPKRLQRRIKQNPYHVRFDTAFHDVITACANAQRANESGTWINDEIIALYTQLHQAGHAHSVECWQDGILVGGLYGVQIGSTFCGESMFSTATDASKIALVHLCRRLAERGFKLLDSQFRNPHLDQFGLYEMPQDAYVALMQAGLQDKVRF